MLFPSTTLLVVSTFLIGSSDAMNVIVMQPDDLEYFNAWTPPPNVRSVTVEFPSVGLPNIERLRKDGLQMMNAYTASPKCGTSRYSTITGKYPSRSRSSQRIASRENAYVSRVTIPTTKMQNQDCSTDNLAATFQRNNFATAMLGKWHLSRFNNNQYTYSNAVATVQNCGFDVVDGLYIENLAANENEFNNYSDGTFSHNMEWITYEAVKFINDQASKSKDFFMYFNPTVPHGSNDIEMALTQFNCTDTANGSLDFEPIVPGMMGTHTTCESYRKSIFERAESADDYGPIWLDDGVGGLIKALEDNNILDDTLFLFQIDHGMTTKGALYEGGNKIPQFIHYPSKIVGGSTSNALVSTIDIAPTIYDFAGITLDYDLDGISWKGVIENANNEEDFFKNERCLFFEMEQDRAVRCGCWKYLKINDITSSSTTITRGNQFGLSNLEHNAFDLCDGIDEYIADDGNNREAIAANLYEDSNRFTSALKQQFEDAMTCHLERTTHDAINQFASCGPQM
ncbi:hypothetical protein CTEN210_09018 [Chaetoceros tenuissimus]|uniref:Sulfatase N-terminal domain-containing protein n=1 Tax=Chaetoceros tenuissimus TaxID=426638 RepID=A0AAD3CUN4_9STRA|nr:hypothetical protein CTEN210_09018 [Chaetoceros tenuissimus]